ncbi:MAG: CAAX prenyl protease-related protein [Planctomycetales bacterium]|nr:CAAX prenyl protease-related protein [Planctomycetales bacterium]
MNDPSQSAPTSEELANPLPAGFLARYPWIVFLAPFIVFMLVGSLEPTKPSPNVPNTNRIEYAFYPYVYTAKIALTTLAIAFVWPGYRTFARRFSMLSVVIGILGGLVWIGICRLEIETRLFQQLVHQVIEPVARRVLSDPAWSYDFGAAPQRSGFNPLVELKAQPLWAYTFLGIRFFGLVIVVALAEEFFLRGFLMRYFVDETWWRVPVGQVNRAALIAGTAVPMLMHPGELLASFVWFSTITWLMLRTKSLWNCVIAHALTNLVLGVYVVASGDWRLM